MIFFFFAANLIAFLLMFIDKESAKSKAWRIPEKSLFLAALVGGGVGGTIGMYVFRHKTRHWYFRYGFPALAGIQIIFVLLLLFK